MRKMVVTEFMSLDGVMEEPRWTFKYWNDEIAKFKGEESSASDALLLGRVTYQGFAAAWPESKAEGADYFNSVRKYVVSKTLEEPLEWNNSTLIKENFAEEIIELTQRPREDITILRSGALVRSLLRGDLIDELRLMVHPVVLGGGKRLFEDGDGRQALELVDSKTFGTGVLYLTYRPPQG